MEPLMQTSQTLWLMWLAFGCGVFVGVIAGVILTMSVKGS